MAMTPENYNGLKNEYESIMQMLSHDLDFNQFNEDSDEYAKVISEDLSKVSSLKRKLQMAYKNMSDILDNIGDTVDVVNVICPVYNFKAGGD